MVSISRTDLFRGFLSIGMMGFGGVALVARHVIVQQRQWLDDREYAALQGFGQILPGANVTNMAVILGRQQGGWLGAVAAVGGLLCVPLLSLLVLAELYEQASSIPAMAHALAAMAASAGGMLIGTAVKSGRKAKLDKAGWLFALSAFAALAVAGVPLGWVLGGLLPASMAWNWHRQRRVA